MMFKNHFRFEAVFCNPASGHEKGRIKNVVGYAKNNFAAHRTFTNLEKWNEDCRKWLELRANGKKHGTTKKIPAQVFSVEKK